MATTYTTNAQLQKPAAADRHWDVPLNANADYLDGLAAVGGLAVTTLEVPSASLSCRIAVGTYLKSNGTVGTYAGGSLTLAASATVYVWLTDAGAARSGTAWPATPYLPLAQVQTGTGTITQIVDARARISRPVRTPRSSRRRVIQSPASSRWPIHRPGRMSSRPTL